MKVLYIGGTGEISFDCIHESVRLEHEVTVFNRGNNNAGLPDECRRIRGDINDHEAYRQLAADEPARVKLIDGSQTREAVAEQVWDAVTLAIAPG